MPENIIDKQLERLPKCVHVRRYYKPRNSYRFEEYYLRCTWERTDVCLCYSNMSGSHLIAAALASTFSAAVELMLKRVEEMGLSETEVFYYGE